MSNSSRQVIARRTAWAMFWLIMAASAAAAAEPRYFWPATWEIATLTGIVAGTAARIWLWRLGGKLDDGFRRRGR